MVKVSRADSVSIRSVLILTVLFVIGIVVTVWLLSAYLPLRYLPDWISRGAFGDMFNFAESLFSGLSLVGVATALILQQLQLELQRQDLHETRAELARSATAQEESQRMMHKQVEVLALNTEIQERTVNTLAQQVAVLRLSARITQLSTLVQGMTQVMEGEMGTKDEQQRLHTSVRHYLQMLEDLIPELTEPSSPN